MKINKWKNFQNLNKKMNFFIPIKFQRQLIKMPIAQNFLNTNDMFSFLQEQESQFFRGNHLLFYKII